MDVAISKEAIPIIKESVNREIILLESKINLIESELMDFEKKYNLKSPEFMENFESGKLEDSQDFFEWWGLLKGLEKLKENLKQAKAVLVYC